MLIKSVGKCIQATLQKLTNVIPSEIRFGRYILPSIVSDSAIQRFSDSPFRASQHKSQKEKRADPDHDTNPMSTL